MYLPLVVVDASLLPNPLCTAHVHSLEIEASILVSSPTVPPPSTTYKLKVNLTLNIRTVCYVLICAAPSNATSAEA